MAEVMQVTDRDAPHWPRREVEVGNGSKRRVEWECYCEFRAPAYEMFVHVETWNNALNHGPFWGTKVMSVCLNRRVVPGHNLVRLHSSLRPGRFKIKCSCGWESKWGWGRGVKEGRLHFEEACCYSLGLDIDAIRRERRGGGFPDGVQ